MLRSFVGQALSRSGLLILIAVAMAGVILVAGPLVAQNESTKSDVKKDTPPPQANVPTVQEGITEALPKANGPDVERERIEKIILEAPTQVNFTDTPLTEAMQFLGSLHKFNVLIDAPHLEEQSIAQDTPINVVLSGITLQSALKIILEPLQLTYVVEDEVVKITTLDAVSERFERRIYDVRALKGSGISAETLSDAITVAISSAAWKPDNGEGGTVVVLGGDLLLVNQTQPAQREIRDLLKQIERSTAARGGSNPPPKGQANVPTF